MNKPDDTTQAPAASRSARDAELRQLLGDGPAQPWWRHPLAWGGLALLVAVAAGLWWWQLRNAARDVPVYVTAEVSRGDITRTVTANGTLNPTRSVEVGSELSGTVSRVLVDVNDEVERGQVLVELDRAKFQDTVVRARGALTAAQAGLAQDEATAREAAANLQRLEEVARLSAGRVPSATELDAARATAARALASVDSARAQVEQARATLATEETNLSKASIRSPIAGVVLARSVDPGNAVAASLQAVTLFTLGEDLRQLTLEASVDEADVGEVRQGQAASFTVSAYPSRRYPARVERVSFGSTITNNVVTYTTDLSVDNADLSLRPGMTATATITATERKGVLRVPNTALRFVPGTTPAAAPAATGGGLVSSMMARPPRPPRNTGQRTSEAGAADAGELRQLWILEGQQPVAIMVEVGISDGRLTEVSGERLSEGLPVIIDQRAR